LDEIAKGLYRLGDRGLPAFLIVGTERIVQIDAGPAFMAPRYIQDIYSILGEGKGPDLLLFTHSHFDHMGGAPCLIRHFPAMRSGGSEHLQRFLSLDRARETMMMLNRSTMDRYGNEGDLLPEDLDYSGLRIDLILRDGDTIAIGGGAFLEVIATPGHTRDSVSYFLPSCEAIFTGEAIGIIPGDEFWVAPEFLSSYDDYLDSIMRVRDLRPKLIVPGHHSVVKGDDVERFFDVALSDCNAFREKIEELIAGGEMDEEEIVHRIKEEEYLKKRKGKQQEEAYILNLKAQVRLIAREMKKKVLRV